MEVGRATSSARLLAALAAALLATACAEPERPEIRHADLAVFAAGAGQADTPRRRVALIGIDGASWSYLRPLFEAGELPALARLVRGGASGTLRSIECHFTPPAWTSMLTGRLPHHTGVYSFGRWDGEAQRFDKVSSNDVQVPAVWDVAGAAGRRVSVIGVPTTYPPHPVNGPLVSGLMTPKTRLPPLELSPAPERRRPPETPLASFSPPLAGALEDAHNLLLPTFLDGSDDGETRYDTVHLRVARKGLGGFAKRSLGEYTFPVGSFSPWVRVRVGEGRTARDGFAKIRFDPPNGGALSYALTPTFLRKQHPFTWPPALGRELYQRFGFYLPHEFLSVGVLPSIASDAAGHARHFFDQPDWDLFLYVFGQSDNAHHLVGFADDVLPVYRAIDAFVAHALETAGEETTLVVASDHGFGAFDHAVDLNQFLAERGLLHWKAQGVIDHERTLVFHNMWHLHFNRRLLDAATLRAHAVEVAPGQEPFDALADHLIAAALELRAPDGRAFPVQLARLPADAVGPAPDLAVLAHDDFWLEFWNVDRPSAHVVRRLEGDERWKHARDGILAVYGGGVPAGRDLGVVDVQDVAPTLLDLMGLPVADDLDGEAIAGLLGIDRPQHRVASYPPLERARVDAPDDPSTFEETLRALGYVRD
ncbi:MAG: alkaline phosphatase family protein [Myxococcota bacterium]